MLAGELTISAKYFSPFANVSVADCEVNWVHLIWNSKFKQVEAMELPSENKCCQQGRSI